MSVQSTNIFEVNQFFFFHHKTRWRQHKPKIEPYMLFMLLSNKSSKWQNCSRQIHWSWNKKLQNWSMNLVSWTRKSKTKSTMPSSLHLNDVPSFGSAKVRTYSFHCCWNSTSIYLTISLFTAADLSADLFAGCPTCLQDHKKNCPVFYNTSCAHETCCIHCPVLERDISRNSAFPPGKYTSTK